MQPGRYPRILPAVPIAQAGQSSSSESTGGAGKESKKRQSSQPRPGACVECRARKTKCDGVRPACRNCSKRGITICLYPERLVNGPKAIELVDILRSVSDERSISLLRRLREKGDLAAVLAEYKDDANENGSPSRFISWESSRHRTSLERELTAHNPKSFPNFPPTDPNILAKSDLLRPRLPASLAAHSDGNDIVAPNAVPSGFAEPLDQPADYYDERLKYLQVDFWTEMRVSNDFAARVISLYMRTDHPLLGLFDSYLFVTDLVSKQTNYCSRFLFHSLMYLGCQMYSAVDENAMQYANGFCRIAEALWKTEKDSYSSMAGAILLSISLMGHGKDHAVLSYATDALKIGTRLGLFSDIRPLTGACQSRPDVVGNDLSAQCYAAWGVFNWNVIVSMFYRQPGSETPASAPTVPIPGDTSDRLRPEEVVEDEAAREIEEDGEDEVEGDGLPEEAIIRRAFPVLCNFWRIVYKSRWIYYAVNESPPLYLRHTLVEYAYRELIAWVESVPPFLLRREQSPHYVVVFHIWLHTAILDMWQPFIRKDGQEVPRLMTFTARDSTPDTAYAASVQQLKQLIVEYRSRHAASTYSILWHNGLIYLVNAMLRCIDPDWRLYLLLCIYGYERLRRPYRISEVVTQGLLTMTMRDTNMSGDEAYKIMEELKGRGLVDVRDDLEDEIRATFMVDLSLALTDPEAARAENLASNFTGMAAFQDLVDLDPVET
ncbi:hypothetical protein F4859DRAFT_506155 [Xylaria cf. heliscus]|nr:hypothetical protein F4859DRAFT_506155 [Xylaria cf. heliscus]